NYLNSVAKGKASEALSYPGIEVSETDSKYITDASLASIEDITIVSDTANDQGIHSITASYTLIDLDGNSYQHETTFKVEPGDKIYGIFDGWAFAENPVATVEVLVSNDWRFNLNQQQIAVVGGVPNQAQQVTVLVPNLYQVEHLSNYFSSTRENIAVDSTGRTFSAELSLEPTQEFVDLISNELNSYLDGCATQTVLQPTGC